MSMKIYNGLRVVDPRETVFGVTSIIATRIRSKFHEECFRVVAEEMSRIIDNPDKHEVKNPERMVFFDAEKNWNEFQDSMGDTSIFNDPLRFSIAFGKANDGHIIACYFCDQSVDYRSVLMDTGLFEDYHYQNNADQEDGISEQEWNKRREDWESILDESSSFGSLPMWELESSSPHVFSYPLIFKPEVDLNLYYTPKQRLIPIIRRAVMDYLVDSHRKSYGEDPEPEDIFDYLSDMNPKIFALVDGLPDDSPLLPEPLESLKVKYGEIPEVKKIPRLIIEDIIEL